MAVGHTAKIIECQGDPGFISSVAPCVQIAGVHYQPVIVDAYIIESASAEYFEGMAEPFDYSLAAAYFAFAFTGVFIMWAVGLICGKVIAPMWR